MCAESWCGSLCGVQGPGAVCTRFNQCKHSGPPRALLFKPEDADLSRISVPLPSRGCRDLIAVTEGEGFHVLSVKHLKMTDAGTYYQLNLNFLRSVILKSTCLWVFISNQGVHNVRITRLSAEWGCEENNPGFWVSVLTTSIIQLSPKCQKFAVCFLIWIKLLFACASLHTFVPNRLSIKILTKTEKHQHVEVLLVLVFAVKFRLLVGRHKKRCFTQYCSIV